MTEEINELELSMKDFDIKHESHSKLNYLETHFQELFPKYSDYELLKDIDNYRHGTGKLFKVLKHFFEEEMYKCHGGRGVNTPMEVLLNDVEMEKILLFISTKPNFYNGNEITNVKSFFRNAGRIAQKVANFPIKEATIIYERYTKKGDIVYDPSCGFGSRMSACMLNGRHYIGTDPNPTLCSKLKNLAEYYTEYAKCTSNCAIFKHGSEVFNKEFVNSIDFSFTSPPYYNIERYGSDNGQSIIKFPEYIQWLNGFVTPTIKNIIQYTKVGGLIAINIKNMTSGKKHKLFDDWFKIMIDNNLEHVENISIKQSSKRDYKDKHYTGVKSDYGEKEQVMVFRFRGRK